MKSSIYVSSEKIELLGYVKSGKRVSVKDYAQVPLPEGAMINGMITDHAALVEALGALRAQRPALFADAALLVDGSSILSKRVLVPKLNAWQYDRLIRDEFGSAMENTDHLICGYQKLGGKPEAILAVAVDRGQVESYLATFQDAGIKLSAIRVGVQAVLNFVDHHPDLQKQTFVLNLIEGVSVMSMVFDNGVNVFMSRTRLYSEDQEQFVQSMHSNLSGLMQFNASQNLGRITHSYYLGLKTEDLVAIREANADPTVRFETLNIYSVPADAEKLPPDAHLSYFGAALGEASVDLARSYRTADKLRKRQQPRKRWLLGLIALLAVLMIPIGFLAYQNFNMMGMNGEVRDFLNDPYNLALIDEIGIVEIRTGMVNRVFTQMTQKEAAQKDHVQLTMGMLDLITDTWSDRVTVERIEYTAATGVMRVNARAIADEDPSAYVDAIRHRALNSTTFGIRDVGTSGLIGKPEVGYTFFIEVYFYNMTPEPAEEEEGQP